MSDFLQPQPRRWPYVAVTVVVLLVALVALLALVNDGNEEPDAQPSSSSGPTRSAIPATPSTSDGSGTVAPEEEVGLVEGSQRVSGVTIGWPHSVSGAVSAAVEDYTQVSSTLDPDRAAAIGRLIADPSWTTAPDEFAAGVVDSRRQLGLPQSGEVDGFMSLDASAYQLRNRTDDDVTVLLLGYLTTNTPSGTQTRIGVFPASMHWTGEDWRIKKGDDVDYGDLAEKPGSAEASQAGWIELRR